MFDSLSGHQSVYSISSLDLKGVSRVLTLRPALNRLGIAGMEQVNLFSTREDFVIDAVRFLSDQHKSYASDPLESKSTISRPLHELTEHNAKLGTTCKR